MTVDYEKVAMEMNFFEKIKARVKNLKRLFVFYRKPEYLKQIKRRVTVRPEDIPAIETSDGVKLCKNPLVSVVIITYNQENFIRQTIDSALMQETDFEYEIIIGDDCSTDQTGEICAEYQKRFPDKIRFITADVNVRNLGGNLTRVINRARGKYIAPLEGDDYWTDPLKLQIQVEVFRKYSEVTLCMTGRETLALDGHVSYAHNDHFDRLFAKSPDPNGAFFEGDDYFAHPLGGPIGTVMYRKSDLNLDELAMFYYRTSFTHYYLLLKKGKGFLLKKPMVMYRVNPNGVWSSRTPFQQAKGHYEYFEMLLLHDPSNKALRYQTDIGWKKFRKYLFPWSIWDFIKNMAKRII